MTAKWVKGERIKDVKAAYDAIADDEVVFHNHKPQNSGWLQNWSISQIRREVMGGRLFKALPNTEVSK